MHDWDTKLGVEGVMGLPWGTHLCQLYRSRSDFLDVLIPYLHSGLERNELCIYVASDPLPEGEARTLFHEVLPGCQSVLRSGQLEISDFRQWCSAGGSFNIREVSDLPLKKLEWSRVLGYEGIRIASNVGPLQAGEWESFMKYEEAANLAVPGKKMIMICSYPLERYGPSELIEIAGNHQFTLNKKNGGWALLETAGWRALKESLGVILEDRRQKELADWKAEKMATIKTLTGGIAQEFNNILTVIMGYTHLLRARMDQDSPLVGYLAPILSSSERAARVIQSLLSFSETHLLNLQLVEVNRLLGITDATLLDFFKENISLRVLPSITNMHIMADEEQMKKVLISLALNGRDAMPSGGTLTIRSEFLDADDAFVRMHGYGVPGARYAVLSVEDTGTGMDKRTLGRIFDPFFTTKEVGKGLGLGLAEAGGIIRKHGGHITCSSELRKGTTFTLYLPCIEEPR